MTNVINLRTIRKRAKRQSEEQRADANRLAFGQSKRFRKQDDALNEKARRNLDQHRITKGDA